MKNKGPVTSLSLFFLLLFFVCTTLSPAKTEIFGYFENRFYLVNNLDLSWDNLKEKFDLGDYNRLRLKLKASPSKKATVNIAVDFFSFHGFITSPLGANDQPGGAEPGGSEVKIDLDRAYVDLYFKKFDLSVGKQRVAMGVSYLWAPLDVFNRVNVFEPKEEKPGTNAIKLYIPLGSSSAVTAVFSPDDNFDTSTSGLRAQTQVAGVDIGATLIRKGNTSTTIYGLDLRGENFIGWWLETGYFTTPIDNHVKVVVGFDYTFPIKKGVYWLNEFFYDAGGAKNMAGYDYSLLLSGERFTLGRSYFFSMLRYGINEFWSASVSYIGNWGDGSYVVYPALSYDISQNINASVGFYFPLGNSGGEFNTANRNMFFVWLKVNF
jgi:hypothetical protein